VGAADYRREDRRELTQVSVSSVSGTPTWALLMASVWPTTRRRSRVAGAITALMTGHAYATSARTAGRMGPHEGYEENAEPMIKRVVRMHRDASYQIDAAWPPGRFCAPPTVVGRRRRPRTRHGVRNAQASVLARPARLVS